MYVAGRWIVGVLVWVLVFFLSLTVLIQIPAVQNRLADAVTQQLSDYLGTRVSLDRVGIAFLDRIVIEGLYVEDPDCDTLLIGKRLTASINSNPVALWQRGLELDEIALYDVVVKVRRPLHAPQSNLDWLLAHFTQEKEPEKEPFQFAIKRIFLQNVTYSLKDSVKGSFLDAHIPQGLVQIHTMDIARKIIRMDQMDLDKPKIRIESKIGNPLPVAIPSAIRQKKPSGDSLSWTLELDNLEISEGGFIFHNWRKSPRKTSPPDQLDFRHLDLDSIDIRLRDFKFLTDTLSGRVENIAAASASGFTLQKLAVNDLMVTPKRIALQGLDLVTPDSRLGDTLVFSFEDFGAFSDFTNSVGMDARFREATLAVEDLMVFAPGLKRNTFFINNKAETFQIQGRVRGTVNDLSGRNLEIALGKGAFKVRGRLDLREITVPGAGYFGVDLQEARTNMRMLKQIIPKLNLPANFDRLGRVQFSGALNGFFATGFTIYGNLRSELGFADLDMTLNLNGGREKATYSGQLSLQNFDLGKWTSNPDFGKVSLKAAVEKGRGLVASTASAELSAQLRSFVFKQYEYKNATLSGVLNRNLFDGDFAIQDDNVDLTFNGKLDFTRKVPEFKFKAALKHIYLQALNLTEKDFTISGNFDLNIRNNKLSNVEGSIQISDLGITLNQDETFTVAKVLVESRFTEVGQRILRLDSDVAEAEVAGIFEMEQLPGIFQDHLLRNHAGFASYLKMKPLKRTPSPARFSFRLNVKDSKGFNYLISPQLAAIKNLEVSGDYKEESDALLFEAILPEFKYGNLKVNGFTFQWNAKNGVAELNTGVDSTFLNEKIFLTNPVFFNAILFNDSLDFGLTYQSSGAKLLEILHLDGLLTTVDSTELSLHFDQTNLTLMNLLWVIDKENHVRFTRNGVHFSNMILKHEEFRIGLENYKEKGARLAFLNFDFHLIDKYWNYPQLEFGGNFNLYAWIENLQQMEGLNMAVIADTMLINNDDWGSLRLEASAPNLKGRINALMSLENNVSQIWGRGFYNLQDIKGSSVSRGYEELRRKYFFATFNLSGVPLRTAEYFMQGVVSGTRGEVNGDITLQTRRGQIGLEGNLVANQGAFMVNYLKTAYHFDQAIIQMNDEWLFDASGVKIQDKYGHSATLTGGIRHTRLKSLRMDAVLNTNRILALDTQKGDNKQFYGHALGSGYARFNGPMDRIDAYIKGTVNDSSTLVIPISSEREAQSINYIHFVDRRNKPRLESAGQAPPSPKGMSVEMDLTIGQEGVMKMIFDEQAGDILEGKGRGNIRILVPRNGSFQMFGDYNIEQGEYLFTLYSVINKKFQVQRGGSIKWSGDPYKAIIRLDAEYKGINTSVSSFLAEFLAGEEPQVKAEASKGTQVDLILNLDGELFQPQINFNIDFPQLAGKLKNYADSKLRLLKQDLNELNRQAFGLIVAGQFLPSDLNVIQAPDVIYNTVSELVSNQLSLLLTDLFSEFIEDGRVLSGIDFQVAYSQYRPGETQGNTSFARGEEFEVTLRQNYFNDRLSVVVGGSLDTGGRLTPTPGAGGAFFGNDIVIEYAISADRSLTLKVYQRLQPDIGGRRLKIGAGVSFRKEYASFNEFIQSIRLSGKKQKGES